MPSRSILIILLAAAGLFAAASVTRAVRYGGAASLIGFGCPTDDICFARENRGMLPSGVVVYRTGGYDGQFFYYIAAAMYSGQEAHVDAPPLRWSRMGFPLLAGWGYLLGPRGLIVSMMLVLLVLHLWSVFELHRFLRANAFVGEAASLAALILAFNPFSLLSFQLQTADGAALSLGLVGVLYYLRGFPVRGQSEGKRSAMFIAFACLALTYLSKETMLAIPAGFGGAAVLSFLFARRERAVEFRRIIFWAATGIPLIAWWFAIGFTPARAAGHGGAPFLGLWRYLQAPDVLYSPRGFLLILLPLFVVLGIVLFVRGFKKGDDARVYFSADLGPALGGAMLAACGLISLATNREYWMNFANIGRMFTVGVLPWILLPAVRPPTRTWRIALRIILGLFVLFSFQLVQREATGKLLPFFIL